MHIEIKGTAMTPITDLAGNAYEPSGARFPDLVPLFVEHDFCRPIGWAEISRASAAELRFTARILEPAAQQSVLAGEFGAISIGTWTRESKAEKTDTGWRFLESYIDEISLTTHALNLACTIDEIATVETESDDSIMATIRPAADAVRANRAGSITHMYGMPHPKKAAPAPGSCPSNGMRFSVGTPPRIGCAMPVAPGDIVKITELLAHTGSCACACVHAAFYDESFAALDAPAGPVVNNVQPDDFDDSNRENFALACVVAVAPARAAWVGIRTSFICNGGASPAVWYMSPRMTRFPPSRPDCEADQTSNVAAAITGQGGLATRDLIVFRQPGTPASPIDGDLWVDTDDPQRGVYRYNGSTWDYACDQTAFNTALAIVGQGSLATRNLIVHRQTTAPASPITGDLWVDTDDPQRGVYRYNGSTWDYACDQTLFNTAAAITGQGALATLNDVANTQAGENDGSFGDNSTYVEIASIASVPVLTGQKVVLLCGGSFDVTAESNGAGAATLRARITRNGVAIKTIDLARRTSSGSGQSYNMEANLSLIDLDTPSAGTYTYDLEAGLFGGAIDTGSIDVGYNQASLIALVLKSA